MSKGNRIEDSIPFLYANAIHANTTQITSINTTDVTSNNDMSNYSPSSHSRSQEVIIWLESLLNEDVSTLSHRKPEKASDFLLFFSSKIRIW